VIMKKFTYWYAIIIMVVTSLTGCNKSLYTTGSNLKSKAGYDEAAFNYVYVEAIKQKLIGNGGDALKYFEQSIKINPQSDAAYYQMAI